MKELGSGRYQPSVRAFFPNTARGHGAQARFRKEPDPSGAPRWVKGKRTSALCNATSCALRTGKGERHHNQEQNRKDWEESVGLRRTERASHHSHHSSNADPKGRLK
jgi:hypothetical protein